MATMRGIVVLTGCLAFWLVAAGFAQQPASKPTATAPPSDVPSASALPSGPAPSSLAPAAAAPGPSASMPTGPRPFLPASPADERSQGGARPSVSAGAPPSFGSPYVTSPVVAPPAAAVYGAASSPTDVRDKPFSDYRPSSPISPYMNLYRFNPSGIDNYNLFVRPALEQQSFNRQAGAELRTLRSATQFQGAAIQQLDQRGHPWHGQGLQPSAATFMNYGQYYPGFGHRPVRGNATSR